MGLPKYRAKADANEAEIIKALEQIGCAVWRLKRPVDLLIGYRGQTGLIEVKNPDGRNRIEPEQQEFIDNWKGNVYVVRTVDEAIAAAVRIAAHRPPEEF